LIGRFIDGGIGLAGTLIVGLYMSAKLRKHLELIKVSQDKLPPPPDASLFARAPEKQPGIESEEGVESQQTNLQNG
jgi:hypothetical protein